MSAEQQLQTAGITVALAYTMLEQQGRLLAETQQERDQLRQVAEEVVARLTKVEADNQRLQRQLRKMRMRRARTFWRIGRRFIRRYVY